MAERRGGKRLSRVPVSTGGGGGDVSGTKRVRRRGRGSIHDDFHGQRDKPSGKRRGRGGKGGKKLEGGKEFFFLHPLGKLIL